jgi:hypothetical protein
MRMPAVLACFLALTGCTTPGTPLGLQVLALNYAVRTVPDASALIASLQSGQTRVSDLLGSTPCNHTADFSTLSPPEVFTSGTPGQTGFSVTIVSLTPVAIPTTNPASCSALDQLEIVIGDPSQALALGARTSSLNGRIWLVDGSRFQTSQFFEARVQTFDVASRRSSGDYRFVNRLTPGSNTVLVVEGSYALTP